MQLGVFEECIARGAKIQSKISWIKAAEDSTKLLSSALERGILLREY